jgi:hypothetical protein
MQRIVKSWMVIVVLVLGTQSCLRTKENECSGFMPGNADSVQAPVRVSINDSIRIKIFATLSNGCQNIAPFVPSVTGNTTRLPLIYAVNGCICTQAITHTYTVYAIPALQRGVFTFEVVHSQGTITKTVEVL